jgi:hypothetical protein
MKAIIEFTLEDDELTDIELKSKLLNKMVDVCDDWLNGNGVLLIDYINYEDDKETHIDSWNIDKSIN